jgi:hypothetical protein
LKPLAAVLIFEGLGLADMVAIDNLLGLGAAISMIAISNFCRALA